MVYTKNMTAAVERPRALSPASPFVMSAVLAPEHATWQINVPVGVVPVPLAARGTSSITEQARPPRGVPR